MEAKILNEDSNLDLTRWKTEGKSLQDSLDSSRMIVGALSIPDDALNIINETLLEKFKICFRKSGNNFVLSIPCSEEKQKDLIPENNKWFEIIDQGNINEFTETGLVLYVNQILQPFGFSLTYNLDKNSGIASNLRIGKTKFRGFSEKSVSNAYRKLGNYLAENAVRLNEESKDEK